MLPSARSRELTKNGRTTAPRRLRWCTRGSSDTAESRPIHSSSTAATSPLAYPSCVRSASRTTSGTLREIGGSVNRSAAVAVSRPKKAGTSKRKQAEASGNNLQAKQKSFGKTSRRVCCGRDRNSTVQCTKALRSFPRRAFCTINYGKVHKASRNARKQTLAKLSDRAFCGVRYVSGYICSS
ncbi:hypothetical protein ACU8KH_01659 [Lachancea thermotolerans]